MKGSWSIWAILKLAKICGLWRARRQIILVGNLAQFCLNFSKIHLSVNLNVRDFISFAKRKLKPLFLSADWIKHSQWLRLNDQHFLL